MVTPPRNLPRFLPTLTEVVNLTDPNAAPAMARSEIEEIVQSVMQRVQGQLEKRLAEEIDTLVRKLVLEQRESLSVRLLSEFETGVRQTVIEAISLRSKVQN